MANPLARRVEQLEQQRPEGLPHIVWCDANDDFAEVAAEAETAHPFKKILVVGWMPYQDLQRKL